MLFAIVVNLSLTCKKTDVTIKLTILTTIFMINRLTIILFLAISFDNVQAFIDGLSDEVPKLPENLESKERYCLLNTYKEPGQVFYFRKIFMIYCLTILTGRCIDFYRPVVGELFYLLADFYFKNKEFRYDT